MRLLPKPVDSLWTLFTAPVVWALHFLASYVVAAFWCARRAEAGFHAVQAGIAGITLLALA